MPGMARSFSAMVKVDYNETDCQMTCSSLNHRMQTLRSTVALNVDAHRAKQDHGEAAARRLG